jgi:hypothetical protein
MRASRQDHVEGAVERLLLGPRTQEAAGLINLALVQLQMFVSDCHVHKPVICEHFAKQDKQISAPWVQWAPAGALPMGRGSSTVSRMAMIMTPLSIR